MSLTLIVIVNVALDAALLGGLAWVLSRPARLTPHARSTPTARARRGPRRGAVRGAAHAAHAAAAAVASPARARAPARTGARNHRGGARRAVSADGREAACTSSRRASTRAGASGGRALRSRARSRPRPSAQRSPAPRRQSTAYQMPTAIRVPSGSTRVRIDPVRKWLASGRAIDSIVAPSGGGQSRHHTA